MAKERIQKLIAQAGIASRRKAEELILEGRVTLNGKAAQLGDKADLDSDSLKVDGKLLKGAGGVRVYLAFNKPRKVISMFEDTLGRPNLSLYLRRIPKGVFPIGRLDFMGEGLLLLTNDGDFAQKLSRSRKVPRVYSVKLSNPISDRMVATLRKGGTVGGKRVRPESVRVEEILAKKVKVEIVFSGMSAVSVREFFEARGHTVERVVRKSIGHISISGVAPGEYLKLKPEEALELLKNPTRGNTLVKKEDKDPKLSKSARQDPKLRAAAAERRESRKKKTQAKKRASKKRSAKKRSSKREY